MAAKIDEFKSYVFAFDHGELIAILDALRAANNDELYDEIYSEAYGDESVEVGKIHVEIDTSELDAALKSARELEDIMKSFGMDGV